MYAVTALVRRPGRSALTALGIGLATALVVLLLAVAEGVQSSSATLAAASGVDLLGASANTSLAGGTFPPMTGAHGLPAAVRAADPNVAAASPWLVASLTFGNDSLRQAADRAPNGSAVPPTWSPTGSGIVGWIPGANGGLSTPTLLAGPGFPSPDDRHFANGTYAGPRSGAIVLDQGLATVLRVGVGDRVWVAPTAPAGPAQLSGWYSSATNFTVVGISEPFWLIPSALLAFTYLSELQPILGQGPGGTDPASLVLIHLTDPSRATDDQARLAAAFPALSFFTLGNILSAVQSALDLYRTFGDLIGGIAVVVAALFTTTVLLMSVDDRSRELAVLRAVGIPRSTVAGYVVQEGILLGLLGLAVGFPLGAVGATLLDRFLHGLVVGLPAGFHFTQLDLGVTGAAIAEVLGLGLLASIAPAIRAITLPVAAELRAP